MTKHRVDMKMPVDDIESILGPGGQLARYLDGFEFRDSQLRMARLIEASLTDNVHAVIEAGTGTGKTFGYLVPLILSEKKAVISTGTKNLQDQIFSKDVPLIKEITQLPFPVALMKGRKNYLCLHRYHQFFLQSSFIKSPRTEIQAQLEKWLQLTEFADRSELSWLADDDPLWDALSASSDQCLGADCHFMEDCFLTKLRSHAAGSKIVIVNHHLFFADLRVKKGGFGEIIPRFQAVVFDEAHNIEEIATTYLGDSLSTAQLMEVIADLEKETKQPGCPETSEVKKILMRLKAGTEQLKTMFFGQGDKGRLDDDALLHITEGPAREIKLSIDRLRKTDLVTQTHNPNVSVTAARLDELDKRLNTVTTAQGADWLSWYERRKRSLVLHTSPLDISDNLKELLYKKVLVTLTSATLSTNDNFDFIRTRLGLPEDTREGIYPSHFDFHAQTLMYIPKDLPPPSSHNFAETAAGRIADILKESGGRALVLFTSYANMNTAHRMLRGQIDYLILKQGEGPKSLLLDAFKKDIHSVLLATGSFWQGVDVPGEALSCLIIDKLPFASPADPLTAARIDAVQRRGGNPFMDYQIPSAVISLKQGLGRLIRKISDKGIFSILDNRLINSGYGRFFLNSLPAIPVTHQLEDLRFFFNRSTTYQK